MEVIGIGTDMVEIARFAALSLRTSFMNKIFSEDEREYFKKRKGNLSVIAGTFAAKEAAMKSMGIGIGDVPLKDISVLRRESGAPYIEPRGKARDAMHKAGGKRFLVTITHNRWSAASTVLLLS